jgi:hypothetical protein
MSEFIVNGKKLKDVIVPPDERSGREGFYPIPGIMVIADSLLEFVPCNNVKVRVTTVIENESNRKVVFLSKEFQKVFRLSSNRDYLVKVRDSVLEFYTLEDGRLVLEINGVQLGQVL